MLWPRPGLTWLILFYIIVFTAFTAPCLDDSDLAEQLEYPSVPFNELHIATLLLRSDTELSLFTWL
jgi:hypothetical protein